jgi:hypothetical protein
MQQIIELRIQDTRGYTPKLNLIKQIRELLDLDGTEKVLYATPHKKGVLIQKTKPEEETA